ncbi:PROTEIN ABIL4-RELATED [Salix purpurea]|uniref:PROTEIN ABIL4-RELATED n=1 Tax=Salix purpurea TaxID=77065 RepID=A0A9Q0SQK8_SALPP|nr:PROTEIN ABIL4-RELATED [Salix purpurea]
MMELDQTRPENPAMTFDEVSMERSKSFIKALQELKNLRPQMYSAAEYCEKSYLHSEQKQMVLDNLKDYAVRALVNAVDHLGTVAYKLTDLLEQQTLDVSTMEVKVSCLNQALSCAYHAVMEMQNASGKSSAVFQFLDKEESRKTCSSGALAQLSSSGTAAGAIMPTFGVPHRELLDSSKPLTAFRSFDNPRHEIVRAPVRSKSMLSAFFVKQKTPKLKAGSAS